MGHADPTVIPDGNGSYVAAAGGTTQSLLTAANQVSQDTFVYTAAGKSTLSPHLSSNTLQLLIGEDDSIYVSDGIEVRALDSTGQAKWGWAPVDWPLNMDLIDSDGAVFVQDRTGKLNAVNNGTSASVLPGDIPVSTPMYDSSNTWFAAGNLPANTGNGIAVPASVAAIAANPIEPALAEYSKKNGSNQQLNQGDPALQLIGDADCTIKDSSGRYARLLRYFLKDKKGLGVPEKYTVFEYQPDDPSVAGCKDALGNYTGISPCDYADPTKNQNPFNEFDDDLGDLSLFPGSETGRPTRQYFNYSAHPQSRIWGISRIQRTTSSTSTSAVIPPLILRISAFTEPLINGHTGPYMGPSKSLSSPLLGTCIGTGAYPSN